MVSYLIDKVNIEKDFFENAENDSIPLMYENLVLPPTKIDSNKYITRHRQQIIARMLVLIVSLETCILP